MKFLAILCIFLGITAARASDPVVPAEQGQTVNQEQQEESKAEATKSAEEEEEKKEENSEM